MEFWKNPEFLRHVRSQLRPSNALTAALVVWAVCALIGMFMMNGMNKFFVDYYFTLLTIQFIGGGLGVMAICGRALVRERTFQTFDFWRTTRLTPSELTIGMLLGAPVTVYFALACSLPISLWAGYSAGFSLGTLMGTYVLFCVFILFLGLGALLTSMLMNVAQSGFSVGVMGFLGFLGVLLFVLMPIWGFVSMSPYHSLMELHGFLPQRGLQHQMFFGNQISFLVASLILYVSLGAWVSLMVVRNIKKNVEEIVLLSRRQVVVFIIFLNVLFCAFVDLTKLDTSMGVERFLALALVFNGFLFYAAGLLSLVPYERLKGWWRGKTPGMASCLAEDAPAWPLLIIAGVGVFGVIVGWLWLMPDSMAAEPLERITSIGSSLLILLVFAIRDTLFLQWCRLTTWQRPIRAGVLYLALYYFFTSVLKAIGPLKFLSFFLTPIGAIAPWMASGDRSSPSLLCGAILVQIVIIGLLHKLILARLRQLPVHPAASTA